MECVLYHIPRPAINSPVQHNPDEIGAALRDSLVIDTP